MADRGRKSMSKGKSLPTGQRTLGSLWRKLGPSVDTSFKMTTEICSTMKGLPKADGPSSATGSHPVSEGLPCKPNSLLYTNFSPVDKVDVCPAGIPRFPLQNFDCNPAPSFKPASELLAGTRQFSDGGGRSRPGQECWMSGQTRKMKRSKQEKADREQSRQMCIERVFKAASVSSPTHGDSVDLPKEVWQRVIAFLPRLQILRNVRGVCRDWRELVDDPSFIPHGKRFYTLFAARGSQNNAPSVALVDRWLLKSDLTTFAGLIGFLQQEPFSTSPINLLPALKASQMFVTDCDSTLLQDWSNSMRTLEWLSDRLSYTVWCLALAAVLFVCNGSVLRALVTLLLSGKTGACPGDAMEFLHLILTALISSGWKDCQQPILRELGVIGTQNTKILRLAPEPSIVATMILLTQVLLTQAYCTETALVYTEVSSETKLGQFLFTNEQQDIICTDLSPGETMIVKAFAGAGKTSALIQYTKRRPELRFAYLSFNRSVMSDATAKFPANTKCFNFHRLAYSKVGWLYRHKLHSGQLKPHLVTHVLNMSTHADVMFAVDTLEMFLRSVDSEVMDHHVPMPATAKKDACCSAARTLWTLMKDKEHHEVPMTHSGYLKLYQLSRPRLDLQYDCLLLDEAQDATPVMADIVLGQSQCRKILVGDPHQQIYGFTGAEDAMQAACNSLEGVIERKLTRSFRFGEEIASVCNSLLRAKGEPTSMVGVRARLPQQKPVVLSNNSLEPYMPVAYIARTNAEVFGTAVAYKKRKLGFVGGIQSYGLDLMRDTWHLLQGKTGEIRHPYVRRLCFTSYQQMMVAAKQTQDVELISRMRIVEHHQVNLLANIEAIEAADVGPDLSRAEVIFSTAHKSKGLEFNTVALGGDFLRVSKVIDLEGEMYVTSPVAGNLRMVEVDEFNLVYVAASRAKTQLLLNSDLKAFLKLQEQMEPGVFMRLMDPERPTQCSECKEDCSGRMAIVSSQIRVAAVSERQAAGEVLLCLTCAQQTHDKFPQVWVASKMIASLLTMVIVLD